MMEYLKKIPFGIINNHYLLIKYRYNLHCCMSNIKIITGRICFFFKFTSVMSCEKADIT